MAVNMSKSARLASQRKVMDEATRRRRARKALESLEQDNFHDDPHADLVMSKKALNLFQDQSGSGLGLGGLESPTKADRSLREAGSTPKSAGKRKSRTTEYYKQRFRKNFAQLLEEDTTSHQQQLPPQPPAAGQQNQAESKKETDSGKKPESKKARKEEKRRQRLAKKPVINYISAQAPPSTRPLRHFCAVCGFNDRLYTCVVCGMKYCSLTCQETHRDTRCLKYTS